MFTGIVQHAGRVVSDEATQAGRRLVIDTSGWTPHGGYRPAMGDSIAVHGVCLTVAGIDEAANTLAFDVITETLDRTTLGGKRAGDRVHLEPAVLPTQPMGGHVVQGHVDGVGRVTEVQADPGDWRLTFSPPADGPSGDLMPYLVPKGSITLDGVSLTLAAVDRNARTATVALIPTTLDVTCLGELAAGDGLNIEADAIVKAVVQTTLATLEGMQQPIDDGVTHETLSRAGFAD
ncbi:MAG: riboflavin synthase [Planctomycetota bacterium]